MTPGKWIVHQMSMIKTEKLTFEYIRRDEEGNVEGITKAVDQVDLNVKQGEFIAILGHNGSGKSTLAKHLNAIFHPTEGTVYVGGRDTKDEKNIWDTSTDSLYYAVGHTAATKENIYNLPFNCTCSVFS